MSGPNNPPSAAATARLSVTQGSNLKRSVQADFDGETRSCLYILTSDYTEPSDPKKMPSHGYTSKVRVRDKYKVIGYISSGTYGRVYKAVGLNGQSGEFAIKKYMFTDLLILLDMSINLVAGSSRTRKAR